MPQCGECNKRFFNEEDLLLHIATHVESNGITCSTCKGHFKDTRLYEEHFNFTTHKKRKNSKPQRNISSSETQHTANVVSPNLTNSNKDESEELEIPSINVEDFIDKMRDLQQQMYFIHTLLNLH